MVQTDIVFATNHAQQIPNLLLADANRRAVLTNVATRKGVSQPALGAADHFDATLLEAEFFEQLSVERILRGFIAFDAALRKLPRVLTHTARPQHLVITVTNDDSNVGAKSVGVNHDALFSES